MSCAYYLLKEGVRVTVLDDGDGSDNCSFGNAGYFSPSHIIPLAAPGMMTRGLKWMLDRESPFYIKPRLNGDLINWGLSFKKAATDKKVRIAAPLLNDLMFKSRELIEELVTSESLDVGLNTQGLIMYCKTKASFKEEGDIGNWASELGQSVEKLTPSEAKAINPGLDLDIYGGVYFKDDACITPHLLMKGLREVLVSSGVEIQYHSSVKGLIRENGSVKSVLVNDGLVHGDEFIIAAGSWTPAILRSIKVGILIQPGKGYSFVDPNPVVMPKIPGILAEAKVAMTPMQHGLRFAGTMELAGYNKDINPVRVRAIANAIPKYFPQFKDHDFSRTEPWGGLRPCSPDGLPYIGRTKHYDNLIVASGHAMLGLTLAPITGRLVSNIIVGRKNELDIKQLDVDRYN